MCSRHKIVITNQHYILVDQVYKLIKKKWGKKYLKKHTAMIRETIDTMPLQIIRKTNSTQLVLDSHNGSQALWKLLRATNSSTSSEYRLESNIYIKGLICERSAYILLTSFNIITTLPPLTNSLRAARELSRSQAKVVNLTINNF